jgi:potassium-dependent mechanosensitive channel
MSPTHEKPIACARCSAWRLPLLPLALFMAVCFGYYYTALKLSDRLINTLYLLMFWLVVEATFVRGLAVAARRLAYSARTGQAPGRQGSRRRRTR